MEIRKVKLDCWEWELSICCDICNHIQKTTMMINSAPNVEQRIRIGLMKSWAMHTCNPRAKREHNYDNESKQVSDEQSSHSEKIMATSKKNATSRMSAAI